MKSDSILYHKHYPPSLEVEEDLDDDELFQRAMARVKPLGGKAKPVGRKRSQKSERQQESEDIVLPWELLETFLEEGTLPGLDDPEYIQGGPHERNPLLVKRLREGVFSVQAELDLSGLSRKEARLELVRFITECRRKNRSCVRIVHGKGNNSRNRVPVLKGLIPGWLSQRRVSRHLVAYTSARPVDGGGGAIYVLLRKG
ncbi:Smr/MutS family endonuclease [Acidobacteria bacterium AH-259-D05]|nr:Smr/MutS family endonuclease [Acidobacteria bacterium AH-259-D05]